MNFLIRLMSSTRITNWIMQRWFEASLYTQLMFGSAVLLVSVGSAAAFWNISQQETQMLLMSVQEINAVMQVAVTFIESSPSITEESLKQLLSPLNSEALVQAVALGGENTIPRLLIANTYAVDTSTYHWLIQALSWVGILNIGQFDPWLHVPVNISGSQYTELLVKVNYNYLESGLAQLFLDNSMQAWFSILTEFMMIFFLLYLPAKHFKRAIVFAGTIHDGQGNVIETGGGARETSDLIRALNTSSFKFKEQQQNLIESKRQTEVLIESTPDAIVVMDNQGSISRLNSEAERLFMDNRSKIIGGSIIEFITPDMVEDWIGQLNNVNHQNSLAHLGHSPTKEFVIINRLGEHIPVSVGFSCIQDSEDTILVICSIRDITFEKEAKQAIERALEKAKEADRVKTQFLTTMSHEMRTPMNGVLGMAELLSATGLSQEQQQYLNTILSTGSSLLTIINDILDYSQLSGGKASLRYQTVSLDELLNTVNSFMSNAAKDKGLTLAMSQTLGKVAIETDVGRVRQVLLHLLGNAVKFTQQGKVVLSVYPLEKTEGKQDTSICFEVMDTGVGIDSSKLAHIFDSFTQADATTTRQHEGTGIGLAICQQTAELLQGNIEVSSVVGHGSVFKFNIPVTVKPIVETTANITQATNAKAQLVGHVLLVEDNLINQKVALALLKKLGLQVDVANDGREAIDLWHKNTYDMIFMDCLMPNVDGFEATRQIRLAEKNDGGTRHTPISALTANALEDDKRRCAESGMDDFVSKPINAGILTEVARKYLKESVV